MKRLILVLAVVLLFGVNVYAQDNYAMSFDALDDYIEVPDSGDWAFGMNNFTIDFWINFSSLPGPSSWNSGILGQWVDSSQRMRMFHSQGAATPYLFFGSMESPPYESYVKCTWDLPVLDTWYHIAVVRRGIATSDWSILIDGAPQTITEGIYDGAVVDLETPLQIGNDSGGGLGSGLNGYMDELRFWNYGMTEQEINDWMYQRAIGSESNLVAGWNFDEGSGDTVNDISGNNHHGVAYGNPEWVISDVPTDPPYLTADPAKNEAQAKKSAKNALSALLAPGSDKKKVNSKALEVVEDEEGGWIITLGVIQPERDENGEKVYDEYIFKVEVIPTIGGDTTIIDKLENAIQPKEEQWALYNSSGKITYSSDLYDELTGSSLYDEFWAD
ncbi:MAG: hypothetical protein HQ549_01035 [Candidatus Omnitrophica bacterium]|nr:hypothetical protein [Candidatus Omnitrophota bacterium]